MKKANRAYNKLKNKVTGSLNKNRQQKEVRADICAVYVRLYTDEEQSNFIYRTGSSCRYVHNHLLSWHDERQEEYIKDNPDRDYNAADVICAKSVKKYNEERYKMLYGEPLEQNGDVPSPTEQRSETSINNELPLSSGRRDVEMPSAGAAVKQQPSKTPMKRQSKCDGK